MVVQEDVNAAREWLLGECHHAHIRATLERGLAYIEAVAQAGLHVESIDGEDMHEFLTLSADTPAFHRHFVQPEL